MELEIRQKPKHERCHCCDDEGTEVESIIINGVQYIPKPGPEELKKSGLVDRDYDGLGVLISTMYKDIRNDKVTEEAIEHVFGHLLAAVERKDVEDARAWIKNGHEEMLKFYD